MAKARDIPSIEQGLHEAFRILKNAGIHNFLIGESLLKSHDIGLKLKQFAQINL